MSDAAAVKSALPNIGEIVGRLLQRVPASERPLLVAIAERMAAERYRAWAELAPAELRAGLLACGERETGIAARVESLHENADARQRALRAGTPELAEVNRSIFAGRSLAEQYAIQAQGERSGAGLWRALAQASASDHANRTYLECAAQEEQSAEFLESLVRQERSA